MGGLCRRRDYGCKSACRRFSRDSACVRVKKGPGLLARRFEGQPDSNEHLTRPLMSGRTIGRSNCVGERLWLTLLASILGLRASSHFMAAEESSRDKADSRGEPPSEHTANIVT
jgi:hypothetical protein